MLRQIFATSMALLWTGTLLSQEPTTKQPPSTCGFPEIYKEAGWTIPGLADAKVKMKGNVKMKGDLTNLPGVTVTVLEPAEPETTITQIGCARNNPARLEIVEAPISVLDLRSYEYKGRVFAYRLSYNIQHYYEGTRTASGADSAVFFYDLEGSGKFTVRKGAEPIHLPELPPDYSKPSGTGSTPKVTRPSTH
jgi:hypothetical protein